MSDPFEPPTPSAIRAALADAPKLRSRDLANQLKISEAQLLAAQTGRGVTRISADPDLLMPAAETLGEVMALTRVEAAVHEKVGHYANYHSGPHASMVLNDAIDLRIFPKHWAHGFLVEQEAEHGLRRSLQVMAFLPLTASLIAVFIGITALANFPGLKGVEADRVLSVVFRDIQSQGSVGYWLVVVLFSAVLAAIMSTADSALLSISSMFSGDLYRRASPGASEKSLTLVGKLSSWALIVILVFLAVALRGTTLLKLLDRKFDLLVQLSPAFFIGLHWSGLRSRPVFAGLVAGLVISLGLALGVGGKPWGIHAGLYGLPVNLVIAVGGSLLAPKERPAAPG